ncbi:MAG: DNA polymerase III subunit delta [Hyphomonadaceae bacterium]
MKIAGAAARRFLDKPDPAIRAALLYGPNRSFISDGAQALISFALKGSDDPFALTKLTDDEIKKDKARLADALVAQSLLGGPRVAWARIETSGGDDAILAALKEIENGAEGATLIVEAGDIGGSSKLVKAFEAATHAASMAFYEETDAERSAFARALLKDEGVTVSKDAADALDALLPADRGLARQEIQKLAAFAHGSKDALSADAISALLPDEGESALDESVNAAVSGRAGEAAEALARVEGLSGVSAIKAMERRMLRLLEARTLMDKGLSAQDAAGKLRPPVFWKERDAFQAQLARWPSARVLRALDALWAAERAAKQAQSPQELLAADAFRRIAALAAR